MEPNTQTNQSVSTVSTPNQTSHRNLYAGLGAGVFIVIIGAFIGMYTWQQSAYAAKMDAVNLQKLSLESELASLKDELAKEKIKTVKETASSSSTKDISLLDTSLVIQVPSDHTLVKSLEKNRRGSYVSYEVSSTKEQSTPRLQEIQFFSEDSIKTFTERCATAEFCFAGDVPNLVTYSDQKVALLEKKDYQKSVLKSFSDREWLVITRPCTGDSCAIREYTTFFGDVKTDIWIMMSTSTEEVDADTLFNQIKFHH